jgi:hypothetical protein
MTQATPGYGGGPMMSPAFAYTNGPMGPGMYSQPVGPVYVAVPAGQSPPQIPGMMLASSSAPAPSAVDPDAGQMQELLLMLHQSLYPSHREWAAETLAGLDWHRHPEVVDALLVSARQDPASTVRAGCVRCLAAMRVNSVTVASTFQSLRHDADVRVRQESEQALAGLGLASSPVVPVSESGSR